MANGSPKVEEGHLSQGTLSFTKKRRRSSDEESLPAKTPMIKSQKIYQSGFHFDFSKDPRILEEQKKILNSSKNSDVGSKIAEKPPFRLGFKSEGKFPSSADKICSQTLKSSPRRNRVYHSPPAFRMASGCPVVKEVRKVTACDGNENTEGTMEKNRYLGSRRLGIFNGTSRTSNSGSKPSNRESLLRNHEPSTSSTKNDGKKRSGWRSHESLKHFDDNIIDLIESEIMSNKEVTGWADVAGLEGAKRALKEIVILPFLRPDIFNGIRAPPKGVLLFGPPGTGKTMIGRCVASQCKATFFNIAASSLTSKWVGEGEKLVRVLFAVARLLQPSIIFIDEIDSLLTSRSESEHESSRRIKTEFLIHLDGVATTSEERLLVLGATNRPQELDDAAKRRFAKRLYIALPCKEARMQIVRSLLKTQSNNLCEEDVKKVGELTEGYSGADMRQLCAEASMYPVRDIIESSCLDIATIPLEQVRPIALQDFVEAIKIVRPTVVEKDLIGYREWDKQFGSLGHTDF